MKRMRAGIVALLLVSFLLSSCGQPQPAAAKAAEEAPLMQEAPAEELILAPLTANGGQDTVMTKEADGLFRAQFEGGSVAGTGETVNGMYRVAATQTDGEAWHVKLESNYPTVAGRDYRVTYRFHSDVAGKVKFGDFQEFEIKPGDNSITGTLIATGGSSYLDLQLGMLPPFTIDFSDVEVEEYSDELEYENALSSPVNFQKEKLVYERHDQGYGTILDRGSDRVTVNYVATSWDTGVWKSKLYIKTGLTPAAGTHYRVAADVECDQDMPFELLFNNGEEEKGYGALYGQNMTAGQPTSCEAVISGLGGGDELVLQFSLGEAPEGSAVTVSNLRVESISDHYTNALPAGFAMDKVMTTGKEYYQLDPVSYTKLPLNAFSYSSTDSVFEGHDDGYLVRLEEDASSATMDIYQAPAAPEDRGVWKAKLYVDTGAQVEAGKTYQVNFDLLPEKDQAEYEVCFDSKTEENAYGALYGRSLTAGVADHISYSIVSADTEGKLVLRIQLGKTDTAAGNKVKISNLSIESLPTDEANVLPGEFTYDTPAEPKPDQNYIDVLPSDFSYLTGVNVQEKHVDGYTQEVSSDGDSATLDITAAPSDGREVWKSRLLISTGFTPDPEKSYLVSFDVTGQKDQGQYEVCFDSGLAENNTYGTPLYGRSLTAGTADHISYNPLSVADGGELVLRILLGNTDDASGNRITVSNLRIVSTDSDGKSLVPESFAYPYVEEPDEGSDAPSYEPVELGTLTATEAHDRAYGQTLNGLALEISTVPPNGGIWSSKLFADTGLTLETGKEYKVTAEVSAEKETKFNLLYGNSTAGGDDNQDGEKAYLGEYEKTVAAGGSLSVDHTFTVPEGLSSKSLILQFQLGNSPEENSFSVDSVKVETVTTGESSTVTVPAGYQDVSIGDPSLTEAHESTYTQSLDGSTLNIDAVPAKSTEPWNSKLFIDTGTELETGAQYIITVDVSSDKEVPFNLCYGNSTDGGNDDEDGEKAYRGEYNKTVAAGGSLSVEHTFTVPEGLSSNDLILQFQLGKSPAGNTFSVDSVVLQKYVETGAQEAGFRDVSLSISSAETHDDGYGQSLEGNTLTVSERPESPEYFPARLFVDTGVKLASGGKYQGVITLSSEEEMDFEICLDSGHIFSGGREKEYGAFYSQHINAGETKDLSFTVDSASEAGSANNLFLQCQFGKSPVDNVITLESVTLQKWEEAQSGTQTPTEVELGTLSASESSDGFDQSLSGTSLTINGLPAAENNEPYWSKLFADTGAELEPGEDYRVTVEVSADKAVQFNLLYGNSTAGGNDDQDGEKAYRGEYNQTVAAGGSLSVEHTFTAPEDLSSNDLILQFQLGKSPAPNSFTLDSVKLEKWEEQHEEEQPGEQSFTELPLNLSYSQSCDSGVEQTLSGSELTVSFLPYLHRAVWNSKLFVDTGEELEPGAKYKVTAVVSSGKEMQFNLLYGNGEDGSEDGKDGEKAFYGEYEKNVSAGGELSVEHEFIAPEGLSSNELILQFQLGNSPADNTFTVESVTLEKWNGDPSQSGPTLHPGSFELWHHEDYSAALDGDGSSCATVSFSSSPDSGREPWKTKLFAETGVTLEAGKAYRIIADVQADAEFAYEICYNDGGSEAAVGRKDNLTASSGSQTVSYDVTPASDADLILQFSLGNAPSGSTVTVSNIRVESIVESDNLMTDSLVAWAPVHTWTDEGYTTSLSNTDSSATLDLSAVPSGDQADWKLKLFVETGAKLESGKSYRIRYKLKADKDFDFNVFYNNGAEEKAVGDFYNLNTGSQTVEHTVTPGKNAELTIQLMLGNSPAPNKLTISDVQVEEIEGGAAAAGAPIHFWAHEDYEASLSNTKSSATIDITKVPSTGREPWKVKLFAETGTKMTAGKAYRISLDVQADKQQDYEICYNNLEKEAALGARYGLSAGPEKQTVTFTATPENDATLTLQLNLGNAPSANKITISGITVKEINFGVGTSVIPSFRCDSVGYISSASDDGYVVSLEQNDDSADFRIDHAPEERNPWNVKLNVKTGITPKAEKGYLVTFDLEAAKRQALFEVFFDGNTEAAYGAQYKQWLIAGKNSLSYMVMPGNGKGELTLQIRLGQTDGTSGNRYTISNLKIQEVSFVSNLARATKPTVELWTYFGYNSTLDKTRDRASVRIDKTPSAGMEPWKTKLFVYTGTTLRAGQKYRISMDVKSIIPAPFEVCFNNGEVEKGLGAMYGLISTPNGQYVEYVTYAREDTQLVIQLSLGNCSAPNTLMLSGLKVEKAGASHLVSDTIYTF